MRQGELFRAEKPPVVVAYGVGVDSTAMLVGMAKRGERPDAITFADTGTEWPETYAYLPIMQAWLSSVGFPAVTTVRYVVRHRRYSSLAENCTVLHTLPGLSFGKKSCSPKWKRGPQDKWVKAWEPFKAAGGKCVRLIGYDSGPKDAKRGWNMADDATFTYRYPLREWGWDRERCQREISDAGLPVPRKSACWCCLSMQPWELDDLIRLHPDLADRIIEIERLAAPYLRNCEGLWRKATRKRPGSMTEWILRRRNGQRVDVPADAACDQCEA